MIVYHLIVSNKFHRQIKPVNVDFKRLLTIQIKSNHILTTLEGNHNFTPQLQNRIITCFSCQILYN